MMKKAICILLCLLTLVLYIPVAYGESAFSVTYVMPAGREEDVLLDADVMTRVTIKRGAGITLKLSNAGAGRTAYIEWFSVPKDAELQQYNADNKLIASTAFQNPDAFRASVLLDAQCVKAMLVTGKEDCTVSTLFVTDTLPDAKYEWTEYPNACDMLFIAPTPASVMEAFGAVLAEYGAAHGVSVGVVYMTADYRYRVQELQHALLAMGIEQAPIWLGCDDLNYLEPNEIHKRWKENKPEDKLVALIRSLDPKVVVCVGETKDDLRAAETVKIVKSVISDTGVRKFYLASESGDTIVDCGKRQSALSDLSACELATMAYRTMKSRGMYRIRIGEKPAFMLVSQKVGTDSAKNDLLENIDKNELIRYTEFATPTPTEVPTAEPTATPVLMTPNPEATEIAGIFEEEIEIDRETPAPVVSEAPKKKGLFSCGGVEETPAPSIAPAVTEAPTEEPTAALTEIPTEEPTAEPTEEPTPEPTEEPTQEPVSVIAYEKTNFDEHFLDYGEEEYVKFDEEAGEWTYRSDILSVEITRITTTMPSGKRTKPVVYFVAHIYEREYDSFRPTFGSWRHNGIDWTSAEEMALQSKSVLWITGDNIIQMDKEMKGTLIRDGYLFQNAKRIDSCVLNPATHTIEIVKRNSIAGEILWENGVQNCFSFGPVLVENGELTKDSKTQRRQENPRTMLGMIEPGHLVAVVVVGRQEGYSVGTNGEETAQLMKDLGCTVAYNLDGGQSAAMVFLGVKLNQDSDGRYNGLSAKNRKMPDGLTWGYSEQCGTYRDIQGNR